MNFNPLKHFTQTALQGLFGLLPVVIVLVVVLWLYGKIDALVGRMFELVGFVPERHEFLWFLFAIIVFFILLYVTGILIQTRLVKYFESFLRNIPGYSTIKDIISIFNSSKEGDNKVLVVAIRGFANEGYNIGLMYSQKESIIKDHYTVEDATFDDNLQYLLSMGVKSFGEVTNKESQNPSELVLLSEWLDVHKHNKSS